MKIRFDMRKFLLNVVPISLVLIISILPVLKGGAQFEPSRSPGAAIWVERHGNGSNGYGNWSGGYGNWSGGYGNWSGGYGNWSGGYGGEMSSFGEASTK